MRSRNARDEPSPDVETSEKFNLVTANAPAHVRMRRRIQAVLVSTAVVVVLLTVMASGGVWDAAAHAGGPPVAVPPVAVPPVAVLPVVTEALVDEKNDADTNGAGAEAADGVGAISSANTAMQLKFPVLKLCGFKDPTWADVQAIVDGDTEPWSPTDIKRHLDAIFHLFADEAAIACLQKLYKALAVAPSGADASTKLFFDLGSRDIDSTKTFLKQYPGAGHFTVHCFEANPKFNPLYPPFQRRHPNVHYHNIAVGVVNTTLTLSDRSVGSSVLEDSAKTGAGGVTVPVNNFADFIARQAGPKVRPGAFGVIKMDIEKMEYAVLHQMLRTGTILVFREFLLECHYTTNLPRAKRDPTKHIGQDDCFALVEALRKVAPPLEAFPAAKYATGLEMKGAPSALEVVLWNSPRHAKATGSRYMERHGNFFPT